MSDGKIKYRSPTGPQVLSVRDFPKLANVAGSEAYAKVIVEDVPRAKALFKDSTQNNFPLQKLRDNMNNTNWRKDLVDLLNQAEDGNRKIQSFKDAEDWNVRTLTPNLFSTEPKQVYGGS